MNLLIEFLFALCHVDAFKIIFNCGAVQVRSASLRGRNSLNRDQNENQRPDARRCMNILIVNKLLCTKFHSNEEN